jgi:hypothetical protein
MKTYGGSGGIAPIFLTLALGLKSLKVRKVSVEQPKRKHLLQHSFIVLGTDMTYGLKFLNETSKLLLINNLFRVRLPK